MTVADYIGTWISIRDRFHYVVDGKSLCGRKLNEDDLDIFKGQKKLPKYFLIPKVEHICKRCSDSLFRIGYSVLVQNKVRKKKNEERF